MKRAPDERARFLAQECEGDTELRSEVESLLAFQAEAESFLESPPDLATGDISERGDEHPKLNRDFGPYTIVAPLGAGGMGEVYCAIDNKLNRAVALKILRPHFTADPERRARFEREARLLATLNHPNIGGIYGMVESDGVTALVLELVKGPTLADRLERGPLPVREALTIARQVAEALGAAHERGIVHRDLTPANIIVQRTSQIGASSVCAKVLDFGLAKNVELLPDSHGSALGGSVAGRIIGTPGYMSPEQARGLAINKQTDIWAFGCVLFEMLTARRAFEADTVPDTIARIVDHDPDWTQLPPETPPTIATLLRRCLRKDPRQRLHDISDALIEIDEATPPHLDLERASAGAARSPRVREWIAWALAVVSVVIALAAFAAYLGGRTPIDAALEFSIVPPDDWYINGGPGAPTFDLSPDGQHLAIIAAVDGRPMLWVRPLDHESWRQLPGTDGAVGLFWSPDSRALGFFADGQLKVVRLAGGSPVTVCAAQVGQVPNGAWNRNDVILFGGSGPLSSVSARGGSPTRVTALASGEMAQRWPAFLPDQQHFMFVSQRDVGNELRIGSLSSSATESLGTAYSHVRYVDGYLLFVYEGRLMARRFDPGSRQFSGDPAVVANRTTVVSPWVRGQFSVSETGRLAYSAIGRPLLQLAWVDRTGRPVGKVGEPGFYNNVSVSADDQRLAVSRFTEPPGLPANADIWLFDLARQGAATRLSFHPAQEFDPSWSRDGSEVAFISARTEGRFSLFRRRSNQSGEDELLVQSETSVTAPDWSPDGRLLLYTENGRSTGADLWTLDLAGDRKRSVFLRTAFAERSGMFSPNGRWIAYESNASGRSEVYVHRFPPAAGPHPISRDSGRAARWRRDGKELFYLTLGGTMMAVDVDGGREFRAGVPHALFDSGLRTLANNHPYDVSRDGQRFLLPLPVNPPVAAPITVVTQWKARLGS